MNVINRHRTCFKLLAVTIIAILISPSSEARTSSQALVDTPIYDFSLPIFDQSGHLSFKTIGTSAIMDENSQFSVQNAEIILPNTTSSEHIISAKSEYALIEPSEQYAHSDTPIKITGSNFMTDANQWEFFGKTRTLVTHGNVHVKINNTNNKELQP